MNISPSLKAQIISDISICESHTERNGSEKLFSELVARYSVLDSSFVVGLSTNGKSAAIDSELDYRSELQAIASKLKMYLLMDETDEEHMSTLKKRVEEFVKRGEKIGKEEYINKLTFSYVSGPQYDVWMNEINIFNQRYLKNHPLHDSINTTYVHRSTKPSAYTNMMGYLKALFSDDEFWKEIEFKENMASMRNKKSLEQMIEEDIERCALFFEDPSDMRTGKQLYLDITSKYDSVINGLGNGLYQYYPQMHFFDPEISGESLLYNLRMLYGKMLSYQATYFPATEKKSNGTKTQMKYDVFISHANVDKIEYVNQLKQSLDKLGIHVFYDKDSLEWGDKWKSKILEGVSQAEFAIIVISENFFGREWTEKELYEFLNRQNSSGQKIILPILHKITISQLEKKYPTVADIQALNSSDHSCDEIALLFAAQLIKRLKAYES